jgi:tellurite resistance protein
MMSFLKGLLDRGQAALTQFSGDTGALSGISAAAALVIAADGKIEDSEIEAAIGGMQGHKVLSASYTGSQIEDAVGKALRSAKTRAGKMELQRAIELLATRPAEIRQDVFLIAADVADDGGIGEDERKVLTTIAKLLNVDDKKLLGE